MAIGLIWAKIVALAVMFVVTMVFGTVANLIVRFFQRRGKTTTNIDQSLTVSLLNCFAGGLFLGTFLLGLLPEVRELFEDVLARYSIESHFPVTEAVAAIGFFAVMLLEHLIEMCQRRTQTHGHGHSHGGSHGDDGGSSPVAAPRPGASENEDRKSGKDVYASGRFTSHGFDNRTSESGRVDDPSDGCNVSTIERSSKQLIGDVNFKLGERNLAFDAAPENTTTGSASEPTPDAKPPVDAEGFVGSSVLSSHPGTSNSSLSHFGSVRAQPGVKSSKKSALRALILVLALSLHTLFEGLALGLLNEETTIWALLIAVSVHKAIIVTALSIELSKDNNNTLKRIYLTLFVFAVMSPAGVGVGTAVTETGSPDDLATDTAAAILQGLATGTFLYVTFFEVLNRELESGYDLRKVFAVMVGFSGIIGLQFLEHSQEH